MRPQWLWRLLPSRCIWRLCVRRTVIRLAAWMHTGKPGAYAGISWYASYPCQLAGDPSEATAQKGELLLNAYVNNLVKLFDLLKKDDVPGELQEEFYMQCYDPQV